MIHEGGAKVPSGKLDWDRRSAREERDARAFGGSGQDPPGPGGVGGPPPTGRPSGGVTGGRPPPVGPTGKGDPLPELPTPGSPSPPGANGPAGGSTRGPRCRRGAPAGLTRSARRSASPMRMRSRSRTRVSASSEGKPRWDSPPRTMSGTARERPTGRALRAGAVVATHDTDADDGGGEGQPAGLVPKHVYSPAILD